MTRTLCACVVLVVLSGFALAEGPPSVAVVGSSEPEAGGPPWCEIAGVWLEFQPGIGSNFLVSEQTSLYLNYSLLNGRTDNGLKVPPRQHRPRRQAQALRQLERLPRGALPERRVANRPHACRRHQPRGPRTLESRRQC